MAKGSSGRRAKLGQPAEPALGDELFRVTFEHSALGMALVGPGGYPLRCNPALQRMLGYSEAELMAMAFTEFTHPDDAKLDWDLYGELTLGQRDAYQIDKRYIRKDGSILWARLTVSRVPSAPDAPFLGIGLVEDVTASKAAEAEQTRLVATLGERVKELTALHKTARVLEDDSSSVDDLVHEIAALLPSAFLFPSDAAARVTYAGCVATTPGFERSGEARLVQEFHTADGARGTVEVAYLSLNPTAHEGPFLAEERTLIDSIADMLQLDLDRRLASAAQRRSEDRLHMALLASNLGVWEWDVEADQLVWSEQLARMVKLEPGQAPRTVAESDALVHPEDRQRRREGIQRAIDDPTGTTHYEEDFRMRLPDGSFRWFRGKGQPLRERQGRVRFLGTTLDITERRMLEDRLARVQKMEAIGRLSADVAHDFNNLLAVITANSCFLREDLPADSPCRPLADEIHEAAERGARLTKQLLAFGRQSELKPDVVSLNKMVEGAEGLVRRMLGRAVALDLVLEPKLGLVRADAGQLEQVLVNLVVNARDAMPNGGRLVIATSNVELDESAAARAEGRAGPHAMLSVRDSGIGMTPETLARIFEPFFTTKEAGKGTGLGLSVVFGIVKQSDGHVTVESTPNQGTVFRVLLPCLAL